VNNWYVIRRPFDSYTRRDIGRMVLLEGNLRQLGLEKQGFLQQLGPEFEWEDATPVPKKRGRRGKQVEAGPPEVEAVREVPGGELRGEDVPTD
jgi:hypothetical protein